MGKIKKFFRYDNVGIIFVLPAFIYMLVFVGYSIVQNIILSMQDVTAANLVRGTKNFVLFENYATLFHDDIFLKSLGNTLLYTVLCLIFQFLIGFALALFFSKRFAFRIAYLFRIHALSTRTDSLILIIFNGIAVFCPAGVYRHIPLVLGNAGNFILITAVSIPACKSIAFPGRIL